MKITEIIVGALAMLAAGTYIYIQNMTIDGLKAEKVLHLEKINSLEGQVSLELVERNRLTTELKDYQDRKAEIEVRYITKPVTVYREIIKTETPEVVETMAKRELNEIFTNVTANAVDFSLRGSSED